MIDTKKLEEGQLLTWELVKGIRVVWRIDRVYETSADVSCLGTTCGYVHASPMKVLGAYFADPLFMCSESYACARHAVLAPWQHVRANVY